MKTNKITKQLKKASTFERKYLSLVRHDYNGDINKSRNFKLISKFFNMSNKGEYTIDNQTWEDLDMDRVYEKIDKTYSSPGEEVLYHMLRNPIMDESELVRRDKLVQLFIVNKNLREWLQCIFVDLSKNQINSFLDMLESELIISKAKYFIYTLLGKVLPLVAILLSIFVDPQFMVGLAAISAINMFINSSERRTIKCNGILYLRKMIKAAKKISNIDEETEYYTEHIADILKEIKQIDRAVRYIGFVNMWGGLFEFLSVIFLIEECAYYAISTSIKQKKEDLINLYYMLGELEAIISISCYQHKLSKPPVKPKFTEEVALNVVEGIHPIIAKPVANTIGIRNKGIVLTGTNMSGKSTFLRMLGVNILFAQTFYFTLTKSYEACFFNIVTSISPNDDLASGKSYYMAEAESILRIINALKKEIPVFCPIDEIFRGTNPVERISTSAEILLYLNKHKTISIVATHDRELADILKEYYEFYYFSEKVDAGSGLSFDYKLKRGVSQTKNAIKLLDYMNYPKVIIENSYKRAKTIEGFI